MTVKVRSVGTSEFGWLYLRQLEAQETKFDMLIEIRVKNVIWNSCCSDVIGHVTSVH